MPKILCVTDKFKGSLTAKEVGIAAQEIWGIQCTSLPLADGGEGTLDALCDAKKWIKVKNKVSGPHYEPVMAHYCIDPESNTAYIEMALASGLQLLPADQRDPLFTTSLGTGELIFDAWRSGVNNIVVFAGGSATHDAGTGLLSGCGYQWYDSKQQNLPPQGESLAYIAGMSSPAPLPRLPEIYIATDVRNPLLGPQGAAYQFAPQKGAAPDIVERLEQGTRQFYQWIQRSQSKELEQPGLGAAGGLALCPVAFWDAQIISATELIFSLLEVEKQIATADIILTGEGKLDQTSLQGKLIHAVCQLARKHQKEVWGIFGEITLAPEECRHLGFSRWESLTSLAGNREAAMSQAKHWLKVAMIKLGR